LRKNSERALYRENPSPQTVVQAFDGSQPLTFEGVVILPAPMLRWATARRRARCCRRSGARKRWKPGMRAAIIREFGDAHPGRGPPLPHGAHVLRTGSIPPSVSPAWRRRQLADAWAAASRGDKNAADLLKAVPAAQRSAGYFFAQAEYLRKQKFSDAAAVVMKAPTDRGALVDPDAWWVERRCFRANWSTRAT
jgi:soluble lytic murein transglycosylase